MDFALVPVQALSKTPDEFVNIARRGIRILFDKDRAFTESVRHLPTTVCEAHLPSEHDFLELVNDFWDHDVWAAKKLGRGELWTAKMCCDSYMKRLLLRIIEWHARATKGIQYDTWHSGRFLEEWADPRALEGLRQSFAHYNAADVRRALLATMDLFRWMAEESAEKIEYDYPRLSDERATELVKSYLYR